MVVLTRVYPNKQPGITIEQTQNDKHRNYQDKWGRRRG